MKYLLIFMCAGIAFLMGCEKELPVPPSNIKPRTVVYAELIAGSKGEVRLGKSKPVGPGINNEFESVPNAAIQLLDKDSNLIETLQYVDDPNNNMSLYRGNKTLEGAHTYRVRVAVPDMKPVSASAWVPPAFKMDLVDTARTMLNGRPVLRFRFNIQPLPAGIRQYIVFEALKQIAVLDTFFYYSGQRYHLTENADLYQRVKNEPGVRLEKDTTWENAYLRIPCYTQDENADNNQIGGLNENYNAILFTQMNKPLNTCLYINATALVANPSLYIPQGRVMVYVKSVSKEYYDFLLTYEKLKRNPGLNSLVQAIQLRSNAIGGLGVIGGVNQKVFPLYFDEL
ncbi:DUF4249 family protein [Chitinophaga solisilvae]|uniref:DUF4249 family protein n=1 Tax=Chitinophaga solisilvae TaxID=1233460 RepID=A0A3S1CVF7_9BACT|nr:DUF4249 family protein [Chitinophaga solisilvae]NSL86500.1 DUF4249 family protein [Chitinophaga solisilvae]